MREDREKIQVLVKTMDIIVSLASGPKTVRDLAEITGVSKPAAYRILHTLELGNFVTRKNQQKEYALSTFFTNLTRQEGKQYDIVRVVVPFMEALNKRYDETINLGVVIGKRVNYLHSIESQQRLRSGNPLHDKDFVHSTALGKAYLSAMDENAFRKIAAKLDLRQQTQKTVTSVSSLINAISKIQKIGYAVDDEENELGSRCVGIALVNRDGNPIAALSVSGPVSRMTPERVKTIGASLKAVAKQVRTKIDQ